MTTNAFSNPPKCFENMYEYNHWRALYKQCGNSPSGYCTDCTPSFKARMEKGGRCQFPSTTFKRDENGGIVGVRSWVRGAA